VTTKKGEKWCVARRYNEFVELREALIRINDLVCRGAWARVTLDYV
jgi:hypothetical protein